MGEKDTPTITQCAANELPSLREEIIKSQELRTTLFQWKLFLVAGLGAVGLGFQSSNAAALTIPTSEYLLAIIPMVCAYVDLLLLHFNLRILVIGKFLRQCQDAYELFCENKRDLYKMEDWALQYSTRFLCALIIFYGVLHYFLAHESVSPAYPSIPKMQWHKISLDITLVASGVLGGVLSFWFQHKFQKLKDKLNNHSYDDMPSNYQ